MQYDAHYLILSGEVVRQPYNSLAKETYRLGVSFVSLISSFVKDGASEHGDDQSILAH